MAPPPLPAVAPPAPVGLYILYIACQVGSDRGVAGEGLVVSAGQLLSLLLELGANVLAPGRAVALSCSDVFAGLSPSGPCACFGPSGPLGEEVNPGRRLTVQMKS